MRYSHVIIFLALILSACQTSENNIYNSEIESYDLSNLEETTFDQLVGDVELIPLRFELETYPNMNYRTLITDSFIYITDTKQLVHTFDLAGHNIACSKIKHGNGPGEYSILMSAMQTSNPDKVALLTPFKLIEYDSKFEAWRESPLQTKIGATAYIYGGGIGIGENKYILLPAVTNEIADQIDLYDAEKERVTKTLKYPFDVRAWVGSSKRNIFHMPNSTILFCTPALSEYVYEIRPDTLLPRIKFTFGPEIITKEEYEAAHKELEEKWAQNIDAYIDDFTDKGIPRSCLINSKKIIHKVDQRNQDYVIVTDRSSHKSSKIVCIENGTPLYPFFDEIDENFLYTVISKSYILKHIDIMYGKTEEEVREALKDIDDEDFVLLKYQIKE